jgi:hypothetical protein
MRKVRVCARPFRQLDHEMPSLRHISLVAHGRWISPTASLRNRPVLASHLGTDKHRRHQASARRLVWAHCRLGKQLPMAQPSRETGYELTCSNVAIFGLLGVGLFRVPALRVAIAWQ